MNNQWFDEQLADIDKKPDSWQEQLGSMFDDDVAAYVDDGEDGLKMHQHPNRPPKTKY